MPLFKSKKVATAGILVAVIMGSIASAQAATASTTVGSHRSAVQSIGISTQAFNEAAGTLRYSAYILKSDTSISKKRAAVERAVQDLEALMPYFRGAAATRLSSDIGKLYSYSRQGLWHGTAGKMEQIAGKLDAVITSYQNGGDGISKYW